MVDLKLNYLGDLEEEAFTDSDASDYLSEFIAFVMRTTPGSIGVSPELGIGVHDMIGEIWTEESRKRVLLAIKRVLNDLPQTASRVAKITVSHLAEQGGVYLIIGITLITGERFFYTLIMDDKSLRLTKGNYDEEVDEYISILSNIEVTDEDFKSLMELI